MAKADKSIKTAGKAATAGPQSKASPPKTAMIKTAAAKSAATPGRP